MNLNWKRAANDAWRTFAPLALGIALILASAPVARLLGDSAFAALLPWVGWVTFVAGIAHAGRRVFHPYVEMKKLYEQATSGNVAAAITFAAMIFLMVAILAITVTRVQAAEPPQAALPYLPMLRGEIAQWWPDMPLRSAAGGQVEICRR